MRLQTEDKYSGMTINERLFEAGLLRQLHEAARRSGRVRLMSILGQAELSEEQVAETTDTLPAHPEKYGY